MVNKYHALIFRKKKGKTIIGVLVRVRFFFFHLKKNESLQKWYLKKKKRSNNCLIMDNKFESLTK